jgi:hypothetical protein
MSQGMEGRRYGGELEDYLYADKARGDGGQEHNVADEEQMHLGIKIIQSAFVNKMHSLEQEIRKLTQTQDEQRVNVASLQKKNSGLEAELFEIHQRSKKLSEEKQELDKTVHSLKKQIDRIEKLRTAVLSSIKDDEMKEAELGDSRALMSDEFLRGATPLTAESLGYGGAYPAATGSAVSRMSAFPPQQPGTQSSQVPPYSTQQGPPQQQAPYFAEPMHANASLDMSQAPVSTGATSPSPIDGKQFFRQARARLSDEAFNIFLTSIKRLNNQQQSREDTLADARKIFGPDFADLYQDFETLLNRHGA